MFPKVYIFRKIKLHQLIIAVSVLSLQPRNKWIERRKKYQIKMNSLMTGETMGPQNIKLCLQQSTIT